MITKAEVPDVSIDTVQKRGASVSGNNEENLGNHLIMYGVTRVFTLKTCSRKKKRDDILQCLPFAFKGKTFEV